MKAVHAAEECLSRGGSPLLAIATGLGKTTIFVELVRRFLLAMLATNPIRVLVLAQSREIVEQAEARFFSQASIVSGVEMAERSSNGEQVVIATVQSMIRRYENFTPDAFDLILFDEAHHTEADSYTELARYFSKAKRAGLTATPERPDRQGLSLFTEVPFVMGVKEGIAEGYLATPRIDTIKLESWKASDQRKTRQENGLDWSAEQLESSFLEKGVAVPVAHAIHEKRGDRKLVAFLPGVEASKRLTEALLALGEKAAHLDGDTPPAERRSLFAKFRSGELDILTNCNVISEGLDVPEIAAVAMIRPTFNQKDFLQCVGRGLRLYKEKAHRDCLVLDFSLTGDVKLGVDVKKALFGSGGADMLDTERSEDGTGFVTPPPDLRFPWADPSEAEGFAFRFTTKEKIFFRGKFVDGDALVALLCSPKPPERREDRTFELWLKMVRLDLTPDPGTTQSIYRSPSDPQKALLKRLVPALRDSQVWNRTPVSGATLDAVLRAQTVRQKAGLSSLATSWTLFRFGFPPNLPRGLATDLVDGIFESNEGSLGVRKGVRLTPNQVEANLESARRVFEEVCKEAGVALAESVTPKEPAPEPAETLSVREANQFAEGNQASLLAVRRTWADVTPEEKALFEKGI